MDPSTQLLLVRLVKFSSVLAYAGGVGIALSSAGVAEKKRAVHLFASPALVLVWLSGYLLTLYQGVPLSELWIVGGFLLSLVSHVLLTRAGRAAKASPWDRVAVLLTLGSALLLMVFRPTWWSLAT